MKQYGQAMLLCCCLQVFSLLFPGMVQAQENMEQEEQPPDWEELLKELDTGDMEAFQQQIRSEWGLSASRMTVKEWLWNFVQGNWQLNEEELLHDLQEKGWYILHSNSRLLGKLLVLSVISALLMQLQSSLQQGAARMAGLACDLALVWAAVLSFQEAWRLGENTINLMVEFMNALLPPMMVLISSLGNLTGAGLLLPVLMTTTTAVANGVKNMILPLVLFSVVLQIMNQLSEGIKVEKLAGFFNRVAQLGLGFMITAFVGFLTVRSTYAAVLDKVVLRTGKFVADHAIPVVGKMLADTLEVAAGYIMILKNALGIYGVLVLLGLLAVPLLQMMAMAMLYQVAAAIAEPLGSSRTANLLEKISGGLWLMTASTASVSLTFFLMIAFIVGFTNNLTLS